MKQLKDRILIVENDPVISDFIGRQALSSAGYQVFTVGDASTAINKVLQITPDLIITNINLPGLSGKDLMVALTSQGIDTPVIVIAPLGKEAEIIQTFRLGAADYLIWPMREAEVLRAVERIIKQVHQQRDRNLLEQKLKETNQQLQQRVRELTAIFSMGKAVTSITDQRILFDRIIKVACQVTYADLGWFLMREEEKNKTFILVAQNQLPETLMDKMQQPWDDGISSLVAMSAESLAMHGDPLRRFRVKTLGQSILIVPVKVQRQVMAILVVMRRQAKPFTTSEQHLLESVADYASISLVNARLFRAIETRAQALERLAKQRQFSEKINHELLLLTERSLHNTMKEAQTALVKLSRETNSEWDPEQRKLLMSLGENLQNGYAIARTLVPEVSAKQRQTDRKLDLVNLTREIGARFLPLARQNHLQLLMELPDHQITMDMDQTHLIEMIKGLITNAIQYCQAQGIIRLQIVQQSDSQAVLTVSNTGNIPQPFREKIFQNHAEQKLVESRRFGGIGIHLALIQEIAHLYQGKIWLDHHPEFGTSFHVMLPVSKRIYQ